MVRVVMLLLCMVVLAYLFTFGAKHQADYDKQTVNVSTQYVPPPGCSVHNLVFPTGEP